MPLYSYFCMCFVPELSSFTQELFDFPNVDENIYCVSKSCIITLSTGGQGFVCSYSITLKHVKTFPRCTSECRSRFDASIFLKWNMCLQHIIFDCSDFSWSNIRLPISESRFQEMADDFSDSKSDSVPLRIRQKEFTSGHLVGFRGEIPDLFAFFLQKSTWSVLSLPPFSVSKFQHKKEQRITTVHTWKCLHRSMCKGKTGDLM